MELKPFDKFDWYGFAGAESFEDGSAPTIGHDQNELDQDFTLIVDGTGVEVIFEEGIYDYTCKPTLAKLIGDDFDPRFITPDRLIALGFVRID